MLPLQALTKRAALLSVVALVLVQGATHPDATWAFRAVVALAFVLGWVGARRGDERMPAVWLAAAPLLPAILWRVTGRQSEPLLDLVWMAGLAASLCRAVSWSRWAFAPLWSALLGGWALALSLAWPVLVLRETGFDLTLLGDPNTINSWAGVSAGHVTAWTVYVTTTQLLALLCFDATTERFAQQPVRIPLIIHAPWIGMTAASVVAISQGAVDVTWLNTEFWANLGRAGGTMLNPNAYGVAAAFAGAVGFVAVLEWRPRAAIVAAAVLAANWLGTWMSGSRTALICAAAAAAGLAWGMRHSARRSRTAIILAGAGSAAALVVALATGNAGPISRLQDGPISTEGISALWNRGLYGPIAVEMVREYPLTGVGIGAYHYLAPDYARVAVNDQLPFDNAQNWWRHQLAELGVFGSVFVFAWSLVLAWHAVTTRARPGAHLPAAVARSLVIGLGLTSLVGMPTQDPRVLMFFLACAAWLVHVTAPRLPDSVASASFLKPICVAGIVLAVAFAAGHLLLARGDLAVATRAARTSRPFAAGAYGLEHADSTPPFHWTDDESRFVWPASTRWLLLSLWAHHPDIDTQPVRVTVSTPCGLLFEQVVDDHSPIDFGIELPAGLPAVAATVQVSRTWRPSDHGGGDSRALGAAIGARFVAGPKEFDDAHTVQWPTCGADRS